jgi:hypothetical protein
MREPDNCSIKYCGFSSPMTSDEVDFEILGLKNAIKNAELRIASLAQTKFLANLAINNEAETLDDFLEQGTDND